MSEGTLDALAHVQRELETVETRRQELIAERDALLRRSWTERIPQSALAEQLGLSMTRTGNLRRRARSAA